MLIFNKHLAAYSYPLTRPLSPSIKQDIPSNKA